MVIASNTTTKAMSAELRCEASGVPDNYTYITWEHTWLGHGPVVRSYPGRNVLHLEALTYEYSGYYTCRVRNGARFSRNPNAGVGSAYLHVQGMYAYMKQNRIYHRFDDLIHGNRKHV